LVDPGEDRRIILKGIFCKWDGEHEMDLSGSEWAQVAGCYECGNKSSSAIKCGEFPD